jgi:TRAP transporter 4TM/12TM fusion protein
VSEKQYDTEEARRLLERIDKGAERETGIFDWLLTQKRMSWLFVLGISIVALTLTFTLYQFLTGYFPAPQAHLHRSVHINMMLIISFLLWPLGRKSWKDRFHFLTVIDIACILLVIAIQVWISYDVNAFVRKEGNLTVLDQTMAMLYIALVLEGTRRTMGMALPLVVVFFIAHTLYTDLFPGVLYGPTTPVEWLAEMQVIQTYGLFGVPITAVSSYVALFITFAVLLTNSGAGKFFTKLALALTGQHIGGPAKASVASSAMMGTISGSTIGNVVGTGSVTIPLMKQTGYKPHFAAAVEACSSSGGMIMPPVMGVVAFVMAEFMGIPYIQVAYAAAIPAFLYFLSIFIQVHFEAVKSGLRPLPKEFVPDLWQTLKEGWYLLCPVVVIVGFLVMGFTVIRAAFWGVVAVYFSTLLNKETRLVPLRLLSTLERAARTIVPVSLACACSGMIIGCLFSSGLGMRFSTLIVGLSGNKLWLALVLTMIVSIILGMGMTATPVYITLASLVIPSLINPMNVYPMAAHMFCLYFGVKSSITPPVALSAYAAAGIAGSSPMRTGNTAFRIGFSGFVVPFLFVYKPELLLHGTPLSIVWTLITCIIAIGCLAVALEGWLFTHINVFERVLLIATSIAFIAPSIKTTIAGFAVLAIVIIIQKVKISKQRKKIPESIETHA